MSHPLPQSPDRPTPFDLVFQQMADETFPRIQAALEAGSHDFKDRDRFLMVREVVTLLHDLRPEEGLGEGISQLAALVHHAFLFWQAGEPVLQLSQPGLSALLSDQRGSEPADGPFASYVQFPERRVWATVVEGAPPEPLDGCFLHLDSGSSVLRVLGVFGLHPDRQGLSVVEASGPRQAGLARRDGTPLFAPILPGGAAARLFSLLGEEELLELGWRSWELGAGSWELKARHSTHSSQLPAPSS